MGLIQTYIVFDGTLSSWWTKIVTGLLLLLFILLQKGLVQLSESALWLGKAEQPRPRISTAPMPGAARPSQRSAARIRSLCLGSDGPARSALIRSDMRKGKTHSDE